MMSLGGVHRCIWQMLAGGFFRGGDLVRPSRRYKRFALVVLGICDGRNKVPSNNGAKETAPGSYG